MDRRRAAGLLLALAACFATATAAPTASNHTALDLYDGAPEGCYYNFQHYGEGDRIMTNEPCLNCTCHNRMLMCYLRVCPFTKPIGQDCTIEKRADQCCPIVTCPDVPVDLLTSTTTSPAEYGPTGMGKLDKYGCSINGKYFSEGSKVPPTPNKPCEHCYCIRNMTTCVMQECTLHVDGCTPIYHKDVCCPVRYSCDHPEDEMPLLDDLSTTVRPTPGFLLTTTTISPVTQMSQDCVYDNRIFPDGALIKTEKACDHCYCMKGDIVCVVQECGTPMENEGKNCTALPPREGVCCPDTYICEGDESPTGTYETDEITTRTDEEKLTTLSPPRRTSSEGSGYRNEPDEGPYTEPSVIEPAIEGSGEEEQPKQPDNITTEKSKYESTDDILGSTEETHEFIPLTTAKPKEEEVPSEDQTLINTGDTEKSTESQQSFPSTIGSQSTKDVEEPITDRIEDIGSGELPEEAGSKPHEDVSKSPVLPDRKETLATTESYEENFLTSEITKQEPSKAATSVTNVPIFEEENTDRPLEQDTGAEDKTDKPTEQDVVINEISDSTSPIPVERDFTSATISMIDEGIKPFDTTEQTKTPEESATKIVEPSNLTTISAPTVKEEVVETTRPVEPTSTSRTPDDFIQESSGETQHYPSSTGAPSIDDEFITTEAQEIATDKIKEMEFFEPQHVTASTPMLEEIEKDTTEYTEPEKIIPSGGTQDASLSTFTTTSSNIPIIEMDRDVTESIISGESISEANLPGMTNIPALDQQEQTTSEYEEAPESPIDTSDKEITKPEDHSFLTTTSSLIDEGKTTLGSGIAVSEYATEGHKYDSSTTVPKSENEEATTEPDKGLNTIPNEGTDEEVSTSSEIHKPTLFEEKVTTEADLADRFSTETEDIITATIPDKSVSDNEPPSLTTESTFSKEDFSPTETQISSKPTTVTADVTEEVISTLPHDDTKNIESVPTLQKDTDTTLIPKYTDSIDETTSHHEISNAPDYESFTTESSVSETITEKSTTSTLIHEKETTTANQEDNEILNEPRIPGEGDCLLNGVTYTNESAVPSTNKCQSGCKCISSIIKCDPIICSPPPEYMDNCETMYDSPDSCCPTYICDHKTETIPPQSHSQMSGTEAPVVPVHCDGVECEIHKDQVHHEGSLDCKSGNCEGSSEESKDSAGYPYTEKVPEKPTIDQKEDCIGKECKQVPCTSENGCQATPIQPCEGEKCETLPVVPESPVTQQCAHGENCAVPSIPTTDCIGGNCDTSSTPLESTHTTELCAGKEGCLDIPKLPEDECKEDHCRRKDSSPLDQHNVEPCTSSDCKSTQTGIETSVAPALEEKPESTDQDYEKNVSETTEKLETITEVSDHTYSVETSATSESHDTVTKRPDIADETVPEIIELVTKVEPETTTKFSTASDKQEATEKTEPLLTESPEDLLTVTKKEDSEVTHPQISDTETEMAGAPMKHEETADTERPQEFITTEKSTADVTEPTKIFPSVTTDSVENLRPETEVSVISEESITEPSVPFTNDSQENTKPSIIDNKDEITTDDSVISSSTDTSKIEDDEKKSQTTITKTQESVTEQSITPALELESATETSDESKPGESSTSIKDDKFTDLPQQATEPAIIDANEPSRESDHTKTVTETPVYDIPTIPAIIDDIQSITVSKSPEVSVLPEEIHHKDTSLEEGTEETVTESSKSSTTEILEFTKSSESSIQELTTQKAMDVISTEASSHDIKEQQEVTVNESEKTTQEILESVTLPSSVQTETQSDIQSLGETERVTTQSLVTEQKVSDDMYHEKTTSKSLEESSTEPIKFYGTKEPTTEPSDESEEKVVTSSVHEDQSKTPVTESYVVPEEVDQKQTTLAVPDKFNNEITNDYPTEQQEDGKSPVETDQTTTSDNTLDDIASEPPKSMGTEAEILTRPDEDTSSKVTGIIEPSLSYTTETQDTSKLSEDKTTIKEITENITEPSKADEEVKDEFITLKPFEKPEIPEMIPISPEQSTSQSDEITTPPTVSDSKITTPKEEVFEDTTDTATYASKPPTTVASPTSVPEEVSQPGLGETKQPEITTATEKEQQIDTDIKVPAFTPTESDELRTTPSEIHDITTSKPIEVSHDTEVKTEYPVVIVTLRPELSTEFIPATSQETFSEESPSSTEKQVIPDLTSSDKLETTVNIDSTKEFATEPSQLSSESKPSIQESYTEEPINKFTSAEPPAVVDLTKVYFDENTVEPMHKEPEKPEKTVDDLIQSLVTDQHEMSTKPSNLEKDLQTQTSAETSSAIPEDDTSKTTQQGAKDELSSSSITPVDKIVTSDKPTEVEIQTESVSHHEEEIESETTTQKKHLIDDSATTQKPEQTDAVVYDVTTEKIAPDTLVTETQQLTSSDKPMDEMQETITASPPTTEKSELFTESTSDTTKISDSQVQTETSESVPAESPEMPTGIEMPTSQPIPEEHLPISEDKPTTETIDKEKSKPTTLEPNAEAEVTSAFEPTTAPKQDYSEVTSKPSEDAVYTNENEEESTKSPMAGDHVTEKLTTEQFVEKEPETLPTVTTEIATPIEEYVTTRKQMTPEVYQTTAPAIDVVKEISTRPSVPNEEESTTLVHDIEQRPPTEEQSIPVVVAETEKPSIVEEDFTPQTERVVPASEQPLEESPVTEEEFIKPASISTTTKAEEEISTLSPSSDRISKPADTLIDSYMTTAPDVYITAASEVPMSVLPEESVTTAPEIIITSKTEVPVTETHEVRITTDTEALVTKSPEASATTDAEIPHVTKAPEEPVTSISKAPETPITNAPEEAITKAPEEYFTGVPQLPITNAPEAPITIAPEMSEEPITIPETPITSSPEVSKESITKSPEMPEELITKAPERPENPSTKAPEMPEEPITKAPETPQEPITKASEMPEEPITKAPDTPEEPITKAPEMPEESLTKSPEMPEEPITKAPESPEELITKAPGMPEEPITNSPEMPQEPITKSPEMPEEPITKSPEMPEEPITKSPEMPEEPITKSPEMPEEPITKSPEMPEEPITKSPEMPEEPITKSPEMPEEPITTAPEMPEESITKAPELLEEPITNASESPISITPGEPELPKEPTTIAPEEPFTKIPETSITASPKPAPEVPEVFAEPITDVPEAPHSSEAEVSEAPISSAPETTITNVPETHITAVEEHITKTTETPLSSVPETPITKAPEAPSTVASEAPITSASELPITAAPELPKPVSTEAQPTDEGLTPDEEGSFPPSGGTSGYGQEPDYVEEDQTFGPGTCRYGGKVYVSAQQIPRDDPCDFCFCFRSDIICLQQSCPPPIHGCHEEPIQGFCCPRYECPVSMATTVNVTTTTTTTTTTLPPHFPTHSYKGSVQKRGCQIKGQTYKVGEVVRASSGPCLHCTCGGDGQMKCDPKVCTPEPMLRQMIAAAVSAKRRR